jgi:EmrB/QacA subfamily drug resistance transporter
MRNSVLVCMSACTLLVMGLVAAINLAVPALASSALHPGAAALLWVVDGYVVVFACLVIPGGALGDRLGRKGILVTGLLLFAAGAVVCAAAVSVPMLLAGRVVSGLGAALVLPNAVGVLVHATAPERRRHALAVWGTVSGMGGLIGNTLGAAVLTTGSWRLLFVAVVPLALGCAVWVWLGVQRSTRSDRRLDPAGTVLLVAATVAVLAGIIEGPEQGWGAPVVIGCFVVGAALAVAFVRIELRSAAPLLDPRLFRIPAVAAAALGMLGMFFGSFGLFYLNASLLQYGRGWSALQAGLGILPLAVPIVVASRWIPRLLARFGIRPALGIAFPATAVGLFGLSLTARADYPSYAGFLVLVGIGFALGLPSLSAELTGSLPAGQAGVAGGLQSATRELGSALGVAVVGTVLTAVFTRSLPPAVAALRPHTVAQALAITTDPTPVIGAFSTGAVVALRVAAIVTLAIGVVVLAVGSRRASTAQPDQAAQSRA